MIKYYRDMWKQLSSLLVPLTELTSVNVPWTLEPRHQKAFDAIKKVISCTGLLSYSDFTALFHIYMWTPANYNWEQLSAKIISQ